MLDMSTWVVFLTAAIALACAPGPGMLYVLSRAASGGKAAGVASACGTAVGGVVHVFAAALGVSAILATSALAFSAVKWLGALFLIYLGLKLILSAWSAGELPAGAVPGEERRTFGPVFFQGIAVEALNPKTALFFLSFVPQFVRPSDGFVLGQFVLLGIIVVALNTTADLLLIVFSGPLARWWQSSRGFRSTQQAISGACLVALGIYLAVSGSNKGSRAAAAGS